MTNKTQKAALYARVSSQGQADKDLSIPSQLKALREFALKRNWTIAAEYVDEAESARTADRPKFQEMIYSAKQKNRPFDVILVWKFSRFARNREDSILYKKMLRKHDVEVISINEPIDDTPSGHLMEAMLEAVDEFYSINLAHDTIRGLKENAAQGFQNGGMAPYGYKRDKVQVNGQEKIKLAIVPTEAPTVKRMFELGLQGLGTKEIIKTLNAEGLKTRAGFPWSKTVVHYMLTNETYTGAIIFNRYKTTLEHRKTNAPEKLIRVDNAHPAIIDKETFTRVKALMHARAPKIMHPREVASEYLLSSLVYCKKCGAKMIGNSAKSGKFFYYSCQNYLKRGKEVCDCGLVPQHKLESAVVGRIRERILTEKNIKQLITLVNDELIAAKGGVSESVAEKEQQIAEVNKRLQKLYTALETGILALDDLAPRIKDLRAQLEALEQSKNALEAAVNMETIQASDEEIKKYVLDLQEFLQNSTLTESKPFLQSWIKRIELDKAKRTGTIEYKMPLIPGVSRASIEVLSMEKRSSGTRIRT